MCSDRRHAATAHQRRADFRLRGADFLIVPTERELEMGVLVPGHRFIPFLAPGLEALELDHG